MIPLRRLVHQRERVAVGTGEERHPEIVVVHRGDQVRRVREGHAARRQLGDCERALPDVREIEKDRSVLRRGCGCSRLSSRPSGQRPREPGPISRPAQAARWVPGLAALARDDAGVNCIRPKKNTFRTVDYNPIFGYIVLTLSHPREVSRTSRGWDRRRWPGNEGAKTDTASRQAQAARSRRADPRATGDRWRPVPAGPYRDAPVCPRSGG